ncbi:putative NBD/HSP70 family sugar kinase [Peribacillus deserti]|uniref:NBD/HSP70 family sugar kinase n=1 Tax=Peribacillus deserti TaxID=673318 RepID=A0ABS2QF30_9BACI|nr:ROK family protein [Peribacillus deserti]MBM7691749.1 putative NBD/HSP70 family sugar kinase [Peribacillus deserti]
MENFMVFDVGGTNVKYAVINEDGEFLVKGEFPSSRYDFDKFRDDITSITIENKQKYDVAGLAFSCPGGVDSETGIIGGYSALPCIHGPNFKEVFGVATGLPVEIENDANSAALGEVWKGAAKDNQNVLFVIIGTGIGGAVIKDRKIHKGANLHGGEVGYMVMDIQKENGGQHTVRTWSHLAATGALVKEVAKVKGMDPSEINGKMIFEAAQSGDQDCVEAINNFYLYLAQGIFNIQYVYDPEKIIIGGAISSRSDLIEQINKKLDLIFVSVPFARVRPVIETCHFKNDANLLGALFHYLQQQNKKASIHIS